MLVFFIVYSLLITLQAPSTAEIKPGKETTIEIVKEKMGLGLSIVGGTDTLLVSFKNV